ncbi:MAG: hypothetical protein AABY22_32260, partial [Nanoarchaeota archaeon]
GDQIRAYVFTGIKTYFASEGLPKTPINESVIRIANRLPGALVDQGWPIDSFQKLREINNYKGHYGFIKKDFVFIQRDLRKEEYNIYRIDKLKNGKVVRTDYGLW